MKQFIKELFCVHRYKGGFKMHPHRYELVCQKCGKGTVFL